MMRPRNQIWYSFANDANDAQNKDVSRVYLLLTYARCEFHSKINTIQISNFVLVTKK